MPPAKKRARTYDPVKTRTAVLAQFGNVREAVGTLTPDQLALPTRLGDWTVRELVAHIGMALTAIHRALDRPAPPRQDAVILDWPFATGANSSAIADFTPGLSVLPAPRAAGGEWAEDLVDLVLVPPVRA